MNLELHLVGNSYIELNGKKLRFSLRKAEAVIFYTAICGPVTRERLKTVFWKDKDAAQASANLRNTIYVIRNAIKNHLKSSRKEIIPVFLFKSSIAMRCLLGGCCIYKWCNCFSKRHNPLFVATDSLHLTLYFSDTKIELGLPAP